MIKLKSRVVGALAIALTFFAVAFAQPGRAADKVGIVLMHGLQGLPNRTITGLAAALEGAGYIVERPEMCWSKTRLYDRTFPDCLIEIDKSVAKLRAAGATTIFVGGQSLGGDAAVAYGATRDGLKGIIGLAPAGDPGFMAQPARGDIEAGVALAQQMVAQGKGGDSASFTSVNLGSSFSIRTTAAIYLSFFGPDAQTRLPETAAKLKAPILWVSGTQDRSQHAEPNRSFAKAPANPLNRFVPVDSDHLGTPDAAKSAVLAWLKDVMAK